MDHDGRGLRDGRVQREAPGAGRVEHRAAAVLAGGDDGLALDDRIAERGHDVAGRRNRLEGELDGAVAVVDGADAVHAAAVERSVSIVLEGDRTADADGDRAGDEVAGKLAVVALFRNGRRSELDLAFLLVGVSAGGAAGRAAAEDQAAVAVVVPHEAARGRLEGAGDDVGMEGAPGGDLGARGERGGLARRVVLAVLGRIVRRFLLVRLRVQVRRGRDGAVGAREVHGIVGAAPRIGFGRARPFAADEAGGEGGGEGEGRFLDGHGCSISGGKFRRLPRKPTRRGIGGVL